MELVGWLLEIRYVVVFVGSRGKQASASDLYNFAGATEITILQFYWTFVRAAYEMLHNNIRICTSKHSRYFAYKSNHRVTGGAFFCSIVSTPIILRHV